MSRDVETSVPHDFHPVDKLLKMCDYNGLFTSGLMTHSGLTLRGKVEIDAGFARVWQVTHDSIKRGTNTEGVLSDPLNVPRRTVALRRQLASSDNISSDLTDIIDRINMYALAVSEENTTDGCAVAALINGACGIIPAMPACYDKFRRLTNERSIACYFLATGTIDTPYKMSASISSTGVDCQGEINVTCSMAAAGLTGLLDGSPAQVCSATEIATEHNLGPACDPVIGQVQIPCIEHNAINTVKAVNTAWMAMRRTSAPCVLLDKVTETMYEAGKDMDDKRRETSCRGLAIKVVCG